ncbi:N-6 DNA methylase [Bacillus sp. FF-1]|uniref:N-6 DNA methylase n=1 Tax=Bacillus sp. FF-1 TaxID=3025192 RepID=UPI00234E90B2|nr:N-6 DNA methylase [Bacillus sp. FF-1]MDC7739552.1 N-6 DNA methylase [Bacillus sp. FF-1]
MKTNYGRSIYAALESIRGYERAENYKGMILLAGVISKTLEKNNKPLSLLPSVLESHSSTPIAIQTFLSQHQEEEIGKAAARLAENLDKNALRMFLQAVSNDVTGTIEEVYAITCKLDNLSSKKTNQQIPSSMKLLFEKEMIKETLNDIYIQGNNDDPFWSLVIAKKYPKLAVHADTMSLDVFDMMQLGAYAYGISNIVIKQGDVLKKPTFILEKGNLQQFDCVISIPAIGPISSNVGEYDEFGRFLFGRSSKRDATLDYVSHALASTKANGRAIILTLGGSLFRGGVEEKVRTAIAKSRQVEGVIKFASSILLNTAVAPYALFLNRNQSLEVSPSIRMVDASEIIGVQGRAKVLESEHIERILSLYQSTENVNGVASTVSIDDVIQNNGEFIPERYTMSERISLPVIGERTINKIEMMDREKTVELGEIAELTNGINIKSSDGQHSIQIIKASDIQGGKISVDELESVSVADLSVIQKAKVQAGDIVLLSRGTSIKFAVVPKGIGNAYASMNLMIIRPKEGVDPYFVQTFLESPFGIWQMEQIQIGTTIQLIKLSDMKKIRVPSLTQEAQIQVGKQYQLINQTYEQALNEAYKAKVESTLGLYEQIGLINWTK